MGMNAPNRIGVPDTEKAFDRAKPISLQTDTSGFVIAGILNQYDAFGDLSQFNFYSRMCSRAEQNYDTWDRNLVATVETLRQWRNYLEGANYKVLIQCDHKNLDVTGETTHKYYTSLVFVFLYFNAYSRMIL
jgi:hypothetical protein